MTLNNLSNCLSDNGQNLESLSAIQESVQLLRQLTMQDPNTYEPGLGEALKTNGRIFKELGQGKEAGIYLQESITILEKYLSICPGLVSRYYREAEALLEGLEGN
ncbi:hypothetical protein DFH11DRAFT_1682418 [Phellopilus nigrolimitatus]|nr:hypothetical protein DFH11DRAFT_1682418 [Phellopilus nigrolimitatus]